MVKKQKHRRKRVPPPPKPTWETAEQRLGRRVHEAILTMGESEKRLAVLVERLEKENTARDLSFEMIRRQWNAALYMSERTAKLDQGKDAVTRAIAELIRLKSRDRHLMRRLREIIEL